MPQRSTNNLSDLNKNYHKGSNSPTTATVAAAFTSQNN